MKDRDVSLGSPPPRRRSGTTVALLGGVLIGALVVALAWVNAEPVTLDLVFWKPRVPTILLIVVPLLVGLVVGWAGATIRAGRKRRRPEIRPSKGRKRREERPGTGGEEADRSPGGGGRGGAEGPAGGGSG